jgi:hypothetical protein
LQQMVCANAQQQGFGLSPTHLATGLAVLHAGLSFSVTMLEQILPTVAAMMPDKAPLFVCLWSGCNALALRVPRGLVQAQVAQ